MVLVLSWVCALFCVALDLARMTVIVIVFEEVVY